MQTFDPPEIAPLVEIGQGHYLLELFHGPTLAFKDIALQILGQLFARALAKRGGRATVVAATSGDTGSAAIAALGGSAQHRGLRAASQGPRERSAAPPDDHQPASPMSTTSRSKAAFDDAQALVKSLFADEAFAKHDQLDRRQLHQFRPHRCADASITSPRRRNSASPPTFVVPTGNFGDIFAGEAAERMGLAGRAAGRSPPTPMTFMARALQRAVFMPRASAHATLSPSMDIQVASNFERALFEASGRDGGVGQQPRWQLSHESANSPCRPLCWMTLRARYSAFASDDAETLATIAPCPP